TKLPFSSYFYTSPFPSYSAVSVCSSPAKTQNLHLAMPKTPSSSSPSTPKFEPGDRVEISKPEIEFLGSWYSGIVVRRDKSNPNHYVVQYDKLFKDETQRNLLQETLDRRQLRPPPTLDEEKKIKFKLRDEVDAYHNDGWWEGTIAAEKPDGNFSVFFRISKYQKIFPEKDLRLHMDWIDGQWTLPFDQRLTEEAEIRPSKVMKLENSEHVKGNNPSGSKEHSKNIGVTSSSLRSTKTEIRPSNVMKGEESEHVKLSNASGSKEHSKNSEFTPKSQRSVEEAGIRPSKVLKCEEAKHVKVNNASGSKEHSNASKVMKHEKSKHVKVNNASGSKGHSDPNKVMKCQKSEHVKVNNAFGSKEHSNPNKVVKGHKLEQVKVHNASGSKEHSNPRTVMKRQKSEPVKVNNIPRSKERCKNSEFPTKKETRIAVKETVFIQGMEVEVTINEEGFKGTWYAARIIEASGKDKYLVEYKTLTNEENTEYLREDIHVGYIRPCPPQVVVVDGFKLRDEVDAYYNDGWWVGVVKKKLSDCRYWVYFKDTNEELVFREARLRAHQDWSNGEWTVPCND
ncbi:Protein AGENET DOMAIN (AGD)-CONTAINING P1, partial [Linum perenne]